jgi:hypothetical protein
MVIFPYFGKIFCQSWIKTVLSAQYCVKNIKFMNGDGPFILFWSDVWIGSNALRSIFPRLYKVSAIQNGLVHEMSQWVNDHWRWNLV